MCYVTYYVTYYVSRDLLERQRRDLQDKKLLQACEAISNAEAEVGRFDTIFQEAEQESVAATQALIGVRQDLEQVKEQEKEINGRWEEGMKERHDLQVCVDSIKIHSVGGSLNSVGATTLYWPKFKKRRRPNKRCAQKYPRRNKTSSGLEWR